jgi:hypothetical protein
MDCRWRNYFCDFRTTSIRFFALTVLLIAMNANADDWVFAYEYGGYEVYVHRPSIVRESVFVRVLEKHVQNPPTPNKLNGKLIKDLLLWNEYDTAARVVRYNHMALKYVDGTKDDLDVKNPQWNPVGFGTLEMLRFLTDNKPHQ